jgi:hypothetical protein
MQELTLQIIMEEIVMSHKVKIYSLVVSLILSSLTAYADNPPPAPTYADVNDATTCNTYAVAVKNYLCNDTSCNQPITAVWFEMFSRNTSASLTRKQCQNNVCTNYFDVNSLGSAQDYGCYIAGSANTAAKNQLLKILQQAYADAIASQDIPTSFPRRFGFYGSDKLCTTANNFAGCTLVVDKIS